ncbi:MAG: tetratricopeptide repeat protein [Nitrospiria bacterium]
MDKTYRLFLILGLLVLLNLTQNCTGRLSLSQKGYQALEEGNIQEAVSYFKGYLQKNPSDVKARNNLAVAYLRQRNYDEAFKELQKVIAQNPRDAAAHYNLALVYYYKKLFDEEIEEYRKTIALSPSHYGAHLNLGHALLAKGQQKEAIQQYLWVIEKDAKNEKVLYTLGVLYMEFHENEKAISMFNRYLRLASEGKFSKQAQAYLDRLNTKNADPLIKSNKQKEQ